MRSAAKNFVLYFYPKDDTPGCTMEANKFTGLDDNFICFDALVGGVSRDELCHALYGVHAHGHADKTLNLIKELK